MATLKTRILHRNDTTANWESINPVLAKGEFGIEWVVESSSGTEGSCKVKVGDGVTNWNNLNYFGGDVVKIVTNGTGNTVVSVNSSTDDFGVTTYTLNLGNRLTGQNLTAEKILVGNGGVDVKTSGKAIVSSLSGSTDVPTDKAVKDYVDALTPESVGAVGSVATEDDDVVILEASKTGTEVTIKGSHVKAGANTTKGPSADVTISGSGATGSIVIPKVVVDEYGHTTGLTEQTLSIEMPTLPTLEVEDNEQGNVVTDVEVSDHKVTLKRGLNVYSKTEIDEIVDDLEGLVSSSGIKEVDTTDDTVIISSVITDAGVATIDLKHAQQGADATKGATADMSVSIGSASNSIKVPYLTVDKYGHTTTLTEKTLTVDLSNAYTKEEVDELVAEQVASAVQYLGTASKLEDLSIKAGKGDFYRAKTDFSAGSEVVHAGDLIIAEKDEPAQSIDGANWSRVHGEEVGVESVTQGSGIAITGTAANPIVSHSDTSSVENLTKKSRTYVSSLTFDEFGHVTAYDTDTETVEDTTYGADRGISLVNGNFGHSNTAVNAVSTSQLLKVKYDQYGHITGSTPVEAKDITDLGIVGTDTTYAAGTGLELKDGTFNHKNSVAAVTSAGLLKVAYDAQGHITGSSAVTKEDIANTGVDINNTWRKIQLEGNDILGSATTTNPFNIKAGTNMTISNSNGTVTFNAASYTASKGIKLVDKDFQLNITTLDGGSAANSGWGTVTE